MNKRSGDWWPCCYSANTTEADVLRLAAKALDVPEAQVEVLKTGSCWLARVRREEDQ